LSPNRDSKRFTRRGTNALLFSKNSGQMESGKEKQAGDKLAKKKGSEWKTIIRQGWAKFLEGGPFGQGEKKKERGHSVSRRRRGTTSMVKSVVISNLRVVWYRCIWQRV